MKRLLVLNLIMIAALCGCSPTDRVVADEKSAETTSNANATSAKVTQLAAQCSACHNNMVDLSAVPADELASAISDVIAAKTPHPTPVPELTSEQVRELAALLRKS